MPRRISTLDKLTVACLTMTGYVYVGYPLLVALAARRRPRENQLPATTPGVTLIISALDEADVMAGKMINTAALDYPPEMLQVVVVTDGSRDGTDAVARAAGLDGWQVLHQPERRGKAAAMSRGVSVARHEIVVFSDANNHFPPDALREVVKPFSDPEVGAVTGAKSVASGSEEVSSGERAYWKYESFIKRQESRLGCCTGVIGELLAVRRELVPSFPSDLVNDDFYVAMRVARSGYRVAYAPDALSIEPTAGSLTEDVVRRRRMVAGRWQSAIRWRTILPLRRPVVMWQVVSHKYLRLFLPFSMAGALLANAAGLVQGGHRSARGARALLSAQVVFYALAAVGDSVPRGLPLVRPAAVAARYLVRTNLASLSGLAMYVRGRRHLHLWQKAGRFGLAPADAAGPKPPPSP